MIKKKFLAHVQKIKELNGDPHYVALGMAIGAFIAVTPTIPFHTSLALLVAILLKASKPAAILGVWICNPLTVIPFYVGAYKVGCLFMNNSVAAMESVEKLIHRLESDVGFMDKVDLMMAFASEQLDVFLFMNLGGLILGLPVGIVTYYITRRFFIKLRLNEKKGRA